MSEALFEVYEPREVAVDAKWSERMMFDLLRQRYAVSSGNGPRYAYAEHMRSGLGFDAKRIADFMAMSLWGSDGAAIHGHEVKVSRSDWLSELKHPEKADAFRPYVNQWWLVVPNKAIVRDDLPDGWGLMAPRGDGRLAIIKRAPKREAEPMPKQLMACFLRAVAKTAAKSVADNQQAVRWVADVLQRQAMDHAEPDWDDRAAAVLRSAAGALR